jgi:predicted permease
VSTPPPSNRPTGPPRHFESLLQRSLPDGIVREDVVGSLAQEHADRVARHGHRRADRWYRRQVLGILTRSAASGLMRGKRRAHPRDVAVGLGRAFRRLARAPAFALAVVATLALGIGGTTAVFAIVHGVLVRPLPYPDAERLVWIRNGAPDRTFSFSMADFLALREQQTHFSQVAAYDPNGVTLTTDGGSERLQAYMVSAEFMELLDLQPLLGRAIAEEDTRPGAERITLLSRGVWETRFGSDPDILGRAVTLDQQATTVVGVLPSPVGPIERDRDFLLPLTLEPPPRKGPFFLRVIGRLREEEARPAASQELAAISERIFPIWQDSFHDTAVRWIMLDLKEAILGDVGTSLWVAMAAVAALLLIALTNAANLTVARAMEREHETAVRAALGAGRGRMLLHRLSETAVLAALGVGAGFGLAHLGLTAAARVGGPFIPRVAEAALSGPVLFFLFLVALVSIALMGLVPALHLRTPLAALHVNRRGLGGDSRAGRLRQALVVAQLSVTVPLLVGGTLMASSLWSLRGVDPGFDADRVLTMSATLPPIGYDGPDSQHEFWQRVLAEVRALPGVEAAGTGNGLPPDDPGFGNNFVLEDIPLAPGASEFEVPWTIADPGYFEALGVELLAGRMFDADTDPPPVALVDESWARRFFSDPRDALGRRFVMGGCMDPTRCDWWTVIGVVSDLEYNGLAQDNQGAIYMDGERFVQRGAFLVVRTTRGDPATLAPAVRAIIRDADPQVPVADVATGRELLDESLRGDTYLAVLVGMFGSVALLLSLVGIYGVLTHFVEQRRRDIGIRLALGGEPRRVAGLVMRIAMRLVVAGVVLGGIVALGASRLMEHILFGVDPWDPASFGAVVVGLSAAALVSCWGPARRAARLDPARTLKEE